MSTWQTVLIVLGVVVAGIAALVLFRKFRKRSERNRFSEFGTKLAHFQLAREGQVDFAQWQHPKERGCEITQTQVDRLRQFIRPGDTVLDIGAYTGDTTVPMALAAGPAGYTLAFEPNPYVFKVLTKNALLNREKTHIVPFNFAATAQNGSFTFHYSDASYCNGGFLSRINRRDHGHEHALEVQGKNLATWLRCEYPAELQRLSYIKIDAEGYDRHVIASIADIIREHRPTIQCEVYKRLDASERNALFDLISSLGYNVFKLESEQTDLGQPLDRDAMARWKHFDIVALPMANVLRRAA